MVLWEAEGNLEEPGGLTGRGEVDCAEHGP